MKVQTDSINMPVITETSTNANIVATSKYTLETFNNNPIEFAVWLRTSAATISLRFNDNPAPIVEYRAGAICGS